MSADTVGGFRTEAPSIPDDIGRSWSEGQLVAERFRIIRCIGQGGMGKVYLTKDEILGRLIALKRVPPEIIFDGDARDDLRQETLRLMDLAHENIIRVHTYYDGPDWPFFAMEYLEGPTLKELLRERKREGRNFAYDEVRAVAAQVGEGLEYAHSKKVVHRDLKPANLMLARPAKETVGKGDLIKITDFGISRVVADSTLRNTGVRSGTLPYMSPEQFRGDECTTSSDVYSLGVTYYELLSGRPPFFTGDIGYQILNRNPKPIPGVSRAVNEVILRAVLKDPRHRYASVAEFTEAIEARNAFPRGGTVLLALRRLRRPLAATAAVAVLVVLLTLGLTADWSKLFDAFRGDDSRAAPPGGLGNALITIDEDTLHEINAEIQHQLADELPYMVNRSEVRFQIRREGALGGTTKLFHMLAFQLDAGKEEGSRSIPATTVKDADKEVPGVIEFVLAELEDGEHSIDAFFREEIREFVKIPLQGLQASLTFVVDTRGPRIEIRASDRGLVVKEILEDPTETHFVTFSNHFRLRLKSDVPGDIERASYAAFTTGEVGRLNPISDVVDWSIGDLGEGVNEFRVYVEDNHGNQSVERLIIHRLHLSAQLALNPDGGVRGNQAAVQGRVVFTRHVELTELPELRFYLNGDPVLDPGDSYHPPTLEDPNFEVVLSLPRHRNTLELQYISGRDPSPFPMPVRVEEIEVLSPAVHFDQKFETHTREGKIVIAGVIDPFFEGLRLYLRHKRNSSGSVDLFPAEDEDGLRARFRQEVYLADNETNELNLEFRYDDHLLEPSLPPLFVYYDAERPSLDRAEWFEYSGVFLDVILEPTEPLKQLRIRYGDEEEWTEEDWIVVSEQDQGKYVGKYVFRVDVPTRRTMFQVELEDLVGHVATEQKEFIYPISDIVDGGRAVPAIGPGQGNIRPAAGRTGSTLVPRCELLERLGLDFRPYAQDEEIGDTEVTEKAWRSFRYDRGAREDDEGSIEMPMVIGEDFDEDLLPAFAEWLEAKCADGYEYFLPTSEQWKRAFTGTRDSRDADTEMIRWFKGESVRGSFVEVPELAYGRNYVAPVRSRRQNQTWTRLFDMESNVQEIVRGEDGKWVVIGGQNRQRASDLLQSCLRERKLRTTTKSVFRDYNFTGFRIARRPKP